MLRLRWGPYVGGVAALGMAGVCLLLLGCGDNAPSSSGRGDATSSSADGGDGTDAQNDFEACITDTRPLELRPLDMMIGLDISGSMAFADPAAPEGADPKWYAVSKALRAFIADPAYNGLGVGLRYFPLWPNICKVEDYAVPAVAIADLPGNLFALQASLDETQPIVGGGTPIVPLMEGLVSNMQEWAQTHTDRKSIIVLATDGIPDDSCQTDRTGDGLLGGLPNTLENAVAVTGAGAKGSPGISTFVIGVGKELTALDQIAEAGTTGKAILVDASQNIEQLFKDALNEVRRRAIFCDFDLPVEGRDSIDFSKVNVRYTHGDVVEDFGRVTDSSACSSANGDSAWYYDDPADPTKIVLCETTCNRVQAGGDGRVDLVFGCFTRLY